MTIAFVNSWNPHLPCSPIDEPRTIILFAKGSFEHFPNFQFKVTTKFGLFTSCALYSLNGSIAWQSGNLDFVVDLVWPSLGDFFKFEHDAYTNGLNVLSIFTFQTMPGGMELMELYSVHLNLIGSPTTTKNIQPIILYAHITLCNF
jgi:hypothetical protein